MALHVLNHLMLGGWRRLISIFYPSGLLKKAGQVALAFAAVIVFGIAWLDQTKQSLFARQIAQTPIIDRSNRRPLAASECDKSIYGQ